MSGRPPGRVSAFAIIGLVGFAAHAATLAPLIAHGVPPTLAWFAGFTVVVAITFVLNRRFTYDGAGGSVWRELVGYVATSAGGAAVNWAVFTGLVALTMPWLPAAAAGTLAGAVWNFLGYGRVFTGRPKA